MRALLRREPAGEMHVISESRGQEPPDQCTKMGNSGLTQGMRPGLMERPRQKASPFAREDASTEAWEPLTEETRADAYFAPYVRQSVGK